MNASKLHLIFLFCLLFSFCKESSAVDEDLQCFANGQCTESFHVDTSKAINEFHCLQICKSEPDCQWFTFFPKLGMCENLANCSNIDSESCPECLSGQKECTGEPVCRVPGQCIESFHIDSSRAGDEEECLRTCKSLVDCQWFTYYPKLELCESLANCSSIDQELCPDCISGQRECEIIEPPVCWVAGECEGNRVSGVVESSSAEKCLQFCKDIPECQWFTFLDDFQACYFFSDCNTLDETCKTCISGEKRCEAETTTTSTTTEETTSTTTTTITPTSTSEVGGEGEVAFIVGGDNTNSVEVYSPEGKCQHKLAPIPNESEEFFKPILNIIDGQILACGGASENRNCWKYDPERDSWTVFTKASHSHNYMPGAIYKGMLYIVDQFNPEVFDPTTSLWTKWPFPSVEFGIGPCMLTWKDSFYLFGGNGNVRGLLSFEHETQTWREISSEIPMHIWYSACLVLPNGVDVLIGSASFSDYYKSAAIYNIDSNRWTLLNQGAFNRRGATLVTLRNRVFYIGGEESLTTEEFDYNTNTWTSMEAPLEQPRLGHAVISVPANLFQHLAGGCQGI